MHITSLVTLALHLTHVRSCIYFFPAKLTMASRGSNSVSNGVAVFKVTELLEEGKHDIKSACAEVAVEYGMKAPSLRKAHFRARGIESSDLRVSDKRCTLSRLDEQALAGIIISFWNRNMPLERRDACELIKQLFIHRAIKAGDRVKEVEERQRSKTSLYNILSRFCGRHKDVLSVRKSQPLAGKRGPSRRRSWRA